ncbi:MAG: hypothetical protein JF616_12830 [Fibrobacteres bacterium]|nr:hypothetical protein [Fibrobacterota bacterium]
MPVKNIPSLPISAALILLAACAQPRMVPPEDVAKGITLEVKNRSSASGALIKEDFDLGPYKVAKVDRSWIHGKGSGFGDYSEKNSKATYSYELLGGARAWKGTCALSKDETSIKLGKGMSMGESKAGVSCGCADGSRSGRIELTRNTSGEFEGSLSPAGQAYVLRPVKETDRKYFGGEPAGYRFDGTDGPRGAVEMLKPGRIWFTEKMADAEREPGACLLAGLMLYREPRDQGD